MANRAARGDARATRAFDALEHGRGDEAIRLFTEALSSGIRSRGDQVRLRCGLAEAYLLKDDVSSATETLGAPPEREDLDPSVLASAWRLHGRIAFETRDQPKAIALLGRALSYAQAAHDARNLGLTHLELSRCYGKVGATGFMREHLAQAASALQALGDSRHLAVVYYRLSLLLGQSGRYDEAATALHQAESLAAAVQAEDVMAAVCSHQANLAAARHDLGQAIVLAERSVALQERCGSSHGVATALATLGQVCVRLGNFERAEQVLERSLAMRSSIQFAETTGAVLDSLAQIHLIRGDYETAEECLRQATEAFGEYGKQASRWYEWSIRAITARLALRRKNPERALALANETLAVPGAPFGEQLLAGLIAIEALLAGRRIPEAAERLEQIQRRLDSQAEPVLYGEFLRLRGTLHALRQELNEAYHDFAQSISVFEMLSERYQVALSRLALGSLLAQTGARSAANTYLDESAATLEALRAAPDLEQVETARHALLRPTSAEFCGSPSEAEDAIVERLVDAAIMPELLARDSVAASAELTGVTAAVLFTVDASGRVTILASKGADGPEAQRLAAAALAKSSTRSVHAEHVGEDDEKRRWLAVHLDRPLGDSSRRRLRLIASVTRQGFELCRARTRPTALPAHQVELPIAPLIPGFVCASAAMNRVVEQIERIRGTDLTVLITGPSGTGKELVARAIHAGSGRAGGVFLPYNCTTTTRELADSQLFGHRRGSFTGAVTDQPGVIRAANGGTLFLDEVGDLSLDVQPKLLRFLEQAEVLSVGDTRPESVNVRVITATNCDLARRVIEGRFREDLYYRLSVIRIEVPPLRERREEIPHLSTHFMRAAASELGKPNVTISRATLDLFDQFEWPGNIRQLRNEIRRAVALAPEPGVIEPEHLSPEIANHVRIPVRPALPQAPRQTRLAPAKPASLSSAVDDLERELILNTLEASAGNISAAARSLGLTRRGLYLKLRRLRLDRNVR